MNTNLGVIEMKTRKINDQKAIQKKKTEKANQESHYRQENKAEPDNNALYEQRSNPLSSKGN